MNIRKATIKDIPYLTSLMGQLGYPVTIEQMTKRFQNIDSHPNYYTLVAEDEGTVLGMIGINTGILYNKDGVYAHIIAFVVDERYRNKGVGKRLIQEAEVWAIQQGADAIMLNSGNRSERNTAHQFYKDRGYEAKSTGVVKNL